MSDRFLSPMERVRKYGEVFTPKTIVDSMIKQSGVLDELNELDSTFLEPAAGNGAFLVEILNHKMQIAFEKSGRDIAHYENNVLIALTSLYGIELLEDNIEMLVMNMYGAFYNEYVKALMHFSGKENLKVLESAKIIIQANIVQGNSLTGLKSDGQKIVLSEWKPIFKNGGKKVQRTEYTLEAIQNNLGPIESSEPMIENEIDLLEGFFENEEPNEVVKSNWKYVPVKYADIYKQIVKEF